jgi:hypothetical protein
VGEQLGFEAFYAAAYRRSSGRASPCWEAEDVTQDAGLGVGIGLRPASSVPTVDQPRPPVTVAPPAGSRRIAVVQTLYSQGAVRVTSIEIGDQAPADVAGGCNGGAW